MCIIFSQTQLKDSLWLSYGWILCEERSLWLVYRHFHENKDIKNANDHHCRTFRQNCYVFDWTYGKKSPWLLKLEFRLFFKFSVNSIPVTHISTNVGNQEALMKMTEAVKCIVMVVFLMFGLNYEIWLLISVKQSSIRRSILLYDWLAHSSFFPSLFIIWFKVKISSIERKPKNSVDRTFLNLNTNFSLESKPTFFENRAKTHFLSCR